MEIGARERIRKWGVREHVVVREWRAKGSDTAPYYSDGDKLNSNLIRHVQDTANFGGILRLWTQVKRTKEGNRDKPKDGGIGFGGIPTVGISRFDCIEISSSN